MNGKRTAVFMLALAMALLLASCQLISSPSDSSQGNSGSSGGSDNDVSEQLDSDTLETLGSLEKIDENFYSLRYQADYGLDEALIEGTASEEALSLFVSEQLLYGLVFDSDAPDLACSSFAASLDNGDSIHGRNMDFDGAQNILVRTEPNKGYASLSMVSGWLLGFIDDVPEGGQEQLPLMAAPYYPLDGINEKGLSVAVLLVYGSKPTYQDTGRTPITTTLAIRMMLDKTATVEEAIELLSNYDMRSISNSGFHFHITDAMGASAIIEYVNDEMRIIQSDDNFQVLTNYYLSTDAIEEYYDGKDRFAVLQTALKERRGILSNDESWGLLEEVVAIHDYDELTGIDYNTAYSIVFDNSGRSLDISVNMDFDKIYHYEVDDS